MKAPKAPKPTAQQLAVERRQSMALDKEIEEQEQRFKAMARGKLGAKSLLSGIPTGKAKPKATSEPGTRTMLGMGGKRSGPYGGMNISIGR